MTFTPEETAALQVGLRLLSSQVQTNGRHYVQNRWDEFDGRACPEADELEDLGQRLALHYDEGEGWLLIDKDQSGLLQIQKDDEADVLASDADAVEYVRARARLGSKPHLAALALHDRDAAEISSLFAPDPRPQVTACAKHYPLFDRHGTPVCVGDRIRYQYCCGRYGQTAIDETVVHQHHYQYGQIERAHFRFDPVSATLRGYSRHEDSEHYHEKWVEVLPTP